MDPTTFEYLKPTDHQIYNMANVRSAFAELTTVVEANVPAGPDLTYLLRKLRECGMWANVAITRQPDGAPRT